MARRQRGAKYITSPKLFATLPKSLPLPGGGSISTSIALTISRAVMAQSIHRLKAAHGSAHATIYSLEVAFAFLMKIRISDVPPVTLSPPKRRKHPKS